MYRFSSTLILVLFRTARDIIRISELDNVTSTYGSFLAFTVIVWELHKGPLHSNDQWTGHHRSPGESSVFSLLADKSRTSPTFIQVGTNSNTSKSCTRTSSELKALRRARPVELSATHY